MRTEFTKIVKRMAFLRSQGDCEECGIKLRVNEFHYDHDLADYLGGDNELSNCKVLCIKCHRLKTRENDHPLIARARRIIEKAANVTKRKHSWGYGRNDPLKKKLNGQVVSRYGNET